MFLHTNLVAETHLTGELVVHVMETMETFIKLWTQITYDIQKWTDVINSDKKQCVKMVPSVMQDV